VVVSFGGGSTIDEYMGPILQSAKTGDLALIRNVG
jgi:hypothetical protein